jgi:hypothetical protein
LFVDNVAPLFWQDGGAEFYRDMGYVGDDAQSFEAGPQEIGGIKNVITFDTSARATSKE